MSSRQVVHFVILHRPRESNLKRKVIVFMRHVANAIWAPRSGKRLTIELIALAILAIILRLAGVTK